MRKVLWATLAVAMWMSAGTVVSAQDTPGGAKAPVVTLSLSGYDAIRGDLGTIGKIVGFDVLKQIDAGLDQAQVAQGGKIPGLDATRPWGAALYFSPEGQPSGFGFVPVTDLKELMKVLKNPLTGEPFSEESGVYEVNLMLAPPVFVTQKGKWAILSNDKDNLKSAPEDPASLLGELPKKYTVAVKASVKNVPEELRKKAIEEMQSGANPAMQQNPGEDEDQYKLRVNLAKQALEAISGLVNDLDEILLGWGVDGTNNATHIDVQVTAKPGTKTAEGFGTLKEAKTNFAGLLMPNAAVTAIGAGTSSDADVAQAKALLDQIRKTSTKELENNADLTKEQRDLATRLISDVMDVLQKTIEAKKSDGGFALVLEPGAPTVVAAAAVADGEKLEKVLKDIVAEAKKEQPDIANMVTLNKETVAGVNLHVATVPIADPEASEVLGKTADIVVGTSADAVYVAAGKNAVDTIKKVIEKSKAEPGKSVLPLQLSVAGTPIAKFVAAVVPMEDVKQVAEKIAGILGQAAGKDHVTLEAKGVPNGMSVRLNVEEGLLKAASAAVPQPKATKPKTKRKAVKKTEAAPF